MANGISDVSLIEFIFKEINYSDGIINKDEDKIFYTTLMLMMNYQ